MCWFIFHKWEKWSKPEDVVFNQPDAWDVFNNPTHYKSFGGKIQGRICSTCGEYQEREVK